MDMQVLANQQKHQLCADTGCSLADNRSKRESEKSVLSVQLDDIRKINSRDSNLSILL